MHASVGVIVVLRLVGRLQISSPRSQNRLGNLRRAATPQERELHNQEQAEVGGGDTHSSRVVVVENSRRGGAFSLPGCNRFIVLLLGTKIFVHSFFVEDVNAKNRTLNQIVASELTNRK